MRKNDAVDSLLDAALRSYADDSTPSGLEARVLARVAEVRASEEHARSSRPRWVPWAFALSAAAALLLAIAVSMWRAITAPKPEEGGGAIDAHSVQEPARSTAQNRPDVSSNRADGSRDMARASAPQPRKRSVAKAVPLPKLDVFPTPRPLSPEEQALVAFATRVPEQQRKAVLEAQQQDNAPLSIAAIKIPPLATPDEGKN